MTILDVITGDAPRRGKLERKPNTMSLEGGGVRGPATGSVREALTL
jgi:hypothetical protein